MKYYTLQDAAATLGVDNEVLQEWLKKSALQPFVDPANPQVYLLNEEQLRKLGREHTSALQPLDGNGHQAEAPEISPVKLDMPVVTIGRYSDNTVVINHPLVSGHHARLEALSGGGHQIVDLRSTRHVYVNGQRVRVQVLQQGDEIAIGPFKFTYTGSELIQQDLGDSIRIDALHVKQYANLLTLLLDDISLAIPARSFVAIVGSSGTGKTTLMNALSGVHPARRGRILYNGQDYYRHLDAFSTQIGYVPQDDIVHGRLRVDKALYYTARMRLPRDFTRAQIKQRVNEVLDDVEMQHRRKSMVKNLSGGERKRVSIALELLANPSVFFLDEPTAGLDPGLDLKMMLLLRKLADKGHTVVLITHATTNIEVCDYLCFLAKGGHLVYYGPPQEAKSYFGLNTYAEIYNALQPTEEDKKVPQEAAERFKQSPYYQRYIVEPLNERKLDQSLDVEASLPRLPRRDHPWRQFSLLSRRYFHLLVNDFGNLLILLLQAPIIGLILLYLASTGTFNTTSIAQCPLRANPVDNTGPIVSYNCQRVIDLLNRPDAAAFLQQQHETKQQALEAAIVPNSGADAQTLLFIMGFAAVLFGCINGAREIVKEAPIYRRERMVNLGIAPYIFSKIIVLGILCLLQSAILVYLVNRKAPFHQGIFLPVFAEIYITMALASLAGLMLGLAVSALAPNTDRAMSLVPIVLIPQVIFSGAIFKLGSPLLQGIGSLFALRWAMAGMGSSVGLHPDKLGVDDFAYQGTLFTSLDPASARPNAIMHLLIVWGALLAIILVLGFLVGIFIKRKDIRR